MFFEKVLIGIEPKYIEVIFARNFPFIFPEIINLAPFISLYKFLVLYY
jgi:hypothetical protein